MYKDTFGIEFPKFGEIYKSVYIRHDLVHRNGKTKDGKRHSMNKVDIEVLCEITVKFIEAVSAELKLKT